MGLWGKIENARTDTSVAFMLVYGMKNVGKTLNTLATCDLPCLYVLGEPRNIWRNIDAANELRKANGLELIVVGENLIIFEYAEFEELIKFIHEHTGVNWDNLKTIVIDSLTHIMSVGFMSEIVEEAHEGRSQKDKNMTKEIASQYKSTVEDYGVLRNGIVRLTDAIGKNARRGITVICLALEDEKQQMVEGSFMKVPLFAGKQYSKEMGGFFDLIGRVTPNIKVAKKDGKDIKTIEYPPIVSFASPNGDFQAKWTGLCSSPNKVFYFDLKKILS